MLIAVVCTMANSNLQKGGNNLSTTDRNSVAKDSLKAIAQQAIKALEQGQADSMINRLAAKLTDSNYVLADSVRSIVNDSIAELIAAHNKAIDDSIRLDSINRKKANGIDSPVEFSAQDSMVYLAQSKNAFFYGGSTVKYENMDLSSDRVSLAMDSSLVRAHGVKDSLGENIGNPIFKMGSDTYDRDTMAFNFKTKKGFINSVYTEQQEGYLRAKEAKRDSSGVMYLKKGTYTTCDDEHPDFYIALSRAKVRPGKDVVFGPAYLVVADVPLPLAVPYGFFPFTKSYSSGFIMPTYGDEMTRGFYLHNGGYYLAISDKIDLKLLGEIYTKGSWGVSAASNYKRRYKYSGSFFFSYQDTRTGDKGMPDYNRTESFKLQWSHRQDAKADPVRTFSASVNFSSVSYERNNLNSMYNPQAMTQSTRTSSISWSTRFSSIGLSLDLSANIAQQMADSTLDVTLPTLNIRTDKIYPFRRKNMVGKERWYEKISLQYTGSLTNSLRAKENVFFKKNIIKDWSNRMDHTIPINATFNFLNYINVTPSFNFKDVTITKKVRRIWDADRNVERRDTTYGFYNVYNWSASVSANTKLYGFYVPNRKIFGDKIQAVRHIMSPSVSFSYNPDFSSSRYGFYDTFVKTDAEGNVTQERYNMYPGTSPGEGMSGTINFSLSNNVEMKLKSDKDTLGYKKISIIDELKIGSYYNMAARERPWGPLTIDLRLKLSKSYTFTQQAVFETYAYELDKDGKPYLGNRTEYSYGRFGRYQGTSANISYTLTPEKILKFFRGGDKKDKDKEKEKEDDFDTGVETNIDDVMEKGKRAKSTGGTAETDEDGYMKFSIPWSLTFSYGITMRENKSGEFNKKTMRYPYEFTQNLNFSGNIQISQGWNISFSSGYDFKYKKLSMTTASLSRDLHCFNMSCSVVLAPYTSYNFCFRCNAATLTDALKYDKRSGSANAVKWY